jgi:hypothetical protein
MFNWLKKLFGSDVPSTPVIAQEPAKEEVKAHVGKVTKVEPAPELKKAEPKKSTAKSKKAKAEKVDLDAMNKTQLLAEAKKRGVKANASLKKAEILEAIKNG